jgi:NNP family nitrate/nitrite transporter-like MFS transporter
MPLVASAFVALGYSSNPDSWRYAMVIPGAILLIMSFVYYKYTKDTPQGNYNEIKRNAKVKTKGSFTAAVKDPRTWLLALAYGACFGVEITIDNVAAVFFVDNFHTSLILAGALAAIFGLMNLFARALGGIVSDRVGKTYGLRGKSYLLGTFLILEGIGLAFFSNSATLQMAIFAMLVFALFLKMANGTTYSIVPFINKKAIGSVSGIVGAGGNLGAVFFGFLFKSASLTYADAFFYIGVTVGIIGLIVTIAPFDRTQTQSQLAEPEGKLQTQTV